MDKRQQLTTLGTFGQPCWRCCLLSHGWTIVRRMYHSLVEKDTKLTLYLDFWPTLVFHLWIRHRFDWQHYRRNCEGREYCYRSRSTHWRRRCLSAGMSSQNYSQQPSSNPISQSFFWAVSELVPMRWRYIANSYCYLMTTPSSPLAARVAISFQNYYPGHWRNS